MVAADAEPPGRLPALFDRGVRVFSPSDSTPEFLARLSELSRPGGPRPILDLARADPAVMGEILDWFEADGMRAGRILLLNRDESSWPGGLARLRALGGTVAVRICSPARGSADEIRGAIEAIAAVPFRGEPGYRGIAIATGFLETNSTVPGLGNAGEVVEWVVRTFDPATARLLIRENALKLIEAMAGESE